MLSGTVRQGRGFVHSVSEIPCDCLPLTIVLFVYNTHSLRSVHTHILARDRESMHACPLAGLTNDQSDLGGGFLG